MAEQIEPVWYCLDCNKCCLDDEKDYYMIKHKLWRTVSPDPDGMLCMDCLETRLGRKLQKSDILPCILTQIINPYTASLLNA